MDSTKQKRRIRDHHRQFPVKKLEALIKLAVDNNLSLLEIGDVKIVPNPKAVPMPTLKILEEAERRAGRPLTDAEKQDEILFGPGGSLKVDE